ncbi:MAG TPA: PfkB family carbohydrate kinase [Acidobacteriota bacterium]|nr:PfkB family carbohydrate kinase [Acidobacteriota bacterium]
MKTLNTPLDKVFFDVKWPENRPFQMVGFGLNAVDWVCIVPRYPEHNSKIQMEALFKMGGGQVATAAAMCARYGMRVRYIGRVGDDEIGKFSLDDLHKEPMEVLVDVVNDAFSQFSIIIVDRVTGERTIIWDRDPKLQCLDYEIPREHIVEGQLLHIDGHDQAAAIKVARWARAAGMKVSIDIDKVQPGVEELLELVDFVLPSQHFVMQFAGTKDWKKGVRTLATVTKGFIGVTCGSAGSAALWENEIFQIPGIKVQAVDTTGAGDVFHGGFIYGLFQNWSVQRCLRFANVAGALSCTRLGARASIPTLDSVLAQMMCE